HFLITLLGLLRAGAVFDVCGHRLAKIRRGSFVAFVRRKLWDGFENSVSGSQMFVVIVRVRLQLLRDRRITWVIAHEDQRAERPRALECVFPQRCDLAVLYVGGISGRHLPSPTAWL